MILGYRFYSKQKPTCLLSVYLLCVHEQTKLEKKVTVKLCRSIVHEVLQGVRTPERPGSPAELYVTEEQEFLRRNPEVRVTSHFLTTSTS